MAQQEEVEEKKAPADVADQRSEQPIEPTMVKTAKPESKQVDKVEKAGAFPKTPEKETIEHYQVDIESEASSSPAGKEDIITCVTQIIKAFSKIVVPGQILSFISRFH